jgi:hypothetical protein
MTVKVIMMARVMMATCLIIMYLGVVEDQDSECYDSQGYHFACQDGCNHQSQGKPVMKLGHEASRQGSLPRRENRGNDSHDGLRP